MKLLQNLFLYIVVAFSFNISTLAQTSDFSQQLWESYPQFKEEVITQRRFQHENIRPLIMELEKNVDFEVNRIGKSIEGRELFLISLGSGEVDVFLWSQMHGDESTATMAIFDIFNFFKSNKFSDEKRTLLKNLRLHFLPMLNPDGAEVFQRRNALGIDINRDALRLQSPEGKTLKRVRDSLDADFGFNLHDQSKYYNAEGSSKPATISFLAPAYNFEKEINEVRANAMKVIVEMNNVLQKFAPGQVAKYNDDFEPRAFGDNIQKWGTSAILIESGGFLDDPEKQEIRKLNFVAILQALLSIASKEYNKNALSDYQDIPDNDSKLYDLKLTGLEYDLLGKSFILDLGINHLEIGSKKTGIYHRAQIADQGDLSTHYAYKTLDVSGYKLLWGKVYPTMLASLEELNGLDFKNLLSNGYSYLKVDEIPEDINFISFPLNIIKEDYIKPSRLGVGMNPTFFLEKAGKIKFAVINGFLYEIENLDYTSGNSLIIR